MKKLIAILMAVVSLMCGGISAMADSHNWDSGKWLRLPTCKVTGLKLLQCTNDGCNATTKVTVARVDHVYLAATCTKAERCQWCDTTKKGSKPLGHKKPEVGCIDQPCDRKDCDVIVVKRKAGMHHYQGATCESPAICALCGIDDATPLGHNFTEATCNAPATCTRCKKQKATRKRIRIFLPLAPSLPHAGIAVRRPALTKTIISRMASAPFAISRSTRWTTSRTKKMT